MYLCYEYRLGNADSSLLYGNRALENSRKINYHVGEVLSLGFMAITTHQTGNLPKALEMGFEALRIAKANNLEDHTGAALNALGETYIVLQDYPKAFDFCKCK